MHHVEAEVNDTGKNMADRYLDKMALNSNIQL